MTRTLLTLMLGVLLAPSASFGVDWLRNGQTGRATTNVSPGGFVTYTTQTDDSTSAVLHTGACEHIDILTFDDPDGNTTDSGVTVQVRSCPPTEASATEGNLDTSACWVIEGVTLDGDSTSNEAIYGVGAVWVGVDEGGTQNSEDFMVLVKCNGSSQ